MPKVSVIIRTKNEAKHLGDLLEMLKKQTFKDLEVIVVDSGSTDGTLEIAKRYGTKIIKIDNDNFTFPYASNIGAENAQGKYLVYISGHCLPLSEKWLADGVRVMESGDGLGKYENKIMGVYCQPVYPLNDASMTERLFLFFGRIIYRGRKIIKKPCMGCMVATNCMLRRDLWEKRRFNSAFAHGGEDREWANYWLAQGYVAIRDFRFTVCHSHDAGPLKCCKQYLYWLSCHKPNEFRYRKHKFN